MLVYPRLGLVMVETEPLGRAERRAEERVLKTRSRQLDASFDADFGAGSVCDAAAPDQ